MYQPQIHLQFIEMRRHDLEARAIRYRRAHRAPAVSKHHR